MDVFEALGQEQTQRPADHLRLRIAKHLLGALIEQDDSLLRINGYDRVKGDAQNAFQPGSGGGRRFLGALALDSLPSFAHGSRTDGSTVLESRSFRT